MEINSTTLKASLLEEGGTKKKKAKRRFFTGRVKGYTIALLAVLAVSPDAMLLRYIRWNAPTGKHGAFDVIVLILSIKYTMMGSIQLGFTLWSAGGIHKLWLKANDSWRALVWPSFFMLITQLGFTIGLLETTAANAIMAFSLNPMWAALMGLVFLKDQVQRCTVLAMAVSGCAVALAFVPSVLWPEVEPPSVGKGAASAEGGSHSTLHGNLIALATGVTLAAFITSSRAGSLSDADAPMGVAPALGSLGAAVLALPFAIDAWHDFSASVIFNPYFVLSIFIDAVLEAFYDLWMVHVLPPLLLPPLLLPPLLLAAPFSSQLLPFDVRLTSPHLASPHLTSPHLASPRLAASPSQGMAAEDITSAEVALVLLLEIPLGPLFVFVAFGETPATYTIAGCVILVVTLVGHGIWEARNTAASRLSSPTSSLASSPKAGAHSSSERPLPMSSSPSLSTMSLLKRASVSWSDDLSGELDLPEGGDVERPASRVSSRTASRSASLHEGSSCLKVDTSSPPPSS